MIPYLKNGFKSWVLTPRQMCDVELLLLEGFYPLNGFLKQRDYLNVLDNMRLEKGDLWPMPITLDVNEMFGQKVVIGETIILRNMEGVPIAFMDVEDKWHPNKVQEAEKVFGTRDISHPAVAYLFQSTGPIYLGGKLEKITLPQHHDFKSLRKAPVELKQFFKENKWERVVAFQTRNPMHRAHQELTLCAMKEHDAYCLIHPVVGMTKPGDVDYCTRVRCYQKILNTYPTGSVLLSLLPLAMRMGGPREALWHAIIRGNYGCTHFIVGRDHAGPGKGKTGSSFYGPYDAQALVKQHENEIGIKMVPFQEVVYAANKKQYVPSNHLSPNDKVLKISGTQFRAMLENGDSIPDWFSYEGVIEELKNAYPPKHQRGLCLFFTGLSGAGKSTLAKALEAALGERLRRPITLLDGDIIRRHLSKGLTFSKEDRDENIRRIGFVASEIVKHRGIVICAQVAPYRAVRREVRQLTTQKGGGFIEIHLSTPLESCEQRDVKGLYQKARTGDIKNFTGISDPYEAPESPEIVIDTSKHSVAESLERIIEVGEKLGYIEALSERAELQPE